MSDYCENCLLLVVVVVEVLLSSPLLLYVPFKDQWLSLLKKRGCIAFEEALLFFFCAVQLNGCPCFILLFMISLYMLLLIAKR